MGISALLRHVLDARIYPGGRNGRNTRLPLLGDRGRRRRATALRRGRREPIGGDGQCRKEAQNGYGHKKSRSLPGSSSGGEYARNPPIFMF
jgi:hypothetical protein